MKRTVGIIIFLVFVVTYGLNVLALSGHHEMKGTWFHYVPGFYIVLGFFGCIAFIVAAKWLGKHFLQRHDGYYEESEADRHGIGLHAADPVTNSTKKVNESL